MSRAKELAKEYAENVMLTVDHRSDVYEAFTDGYEQAEKDNELTWKDLETIDDISIDVFKDGFDVLTKEYYQEVLKRFKDLKK